MYALNVGQQIEADWICWRRARLGSCCSFNSIATLIDACVGLWLWALALIWLRTFALDLVRASPYTDSLATNCPAEVAADTALKRVLLLPSVVLAAFIGPLSIRLKQIVFNLTAKERKRASRAGCKQSTAVARANTNHPVQRQLLASSDKHPSVWQQLP